MTLEETRKRMEASLARKRINAGLANGAATTSESPQSPVTSGAMDSLLEKLRAAAPQARDQRDRRRRARLKERHQVRVASGQHIPDNAGEEQSAGNGDGASNAAADGDAESGPTETGLLSPPHPETEPGSDAKGSQLSESEDVADRAASMLQGLRDNTDPERTRRRREGAEEERRKRRARRRNGPTNGSKDSGDGSVMSPQPEPATPPGTDPIEPDDEAASQPTSPPSIVVSEPNRHSSDGDESAHGSPKGQPAAAEPSP